MIPDAGAASVYAGLAAELAIETLAITTVA
jgi:hypothetical protein